MISVSTSIIFLLIWFASDPMRLRVLVGVARILRDEVPVQLYVDGASLENVRCFREGKLFHGGKSNRLVLWIDDPKGICGRHILIVDPDSEKVYSPNCSLDHYKLVDKKWLFQSDSGALGVAFGYPKLDRNDPNFQQAGNIISFTIPPVLDLPPGRWELRVN